MSSAKGRVRTANLGGARPCRLRPGALDQIDAWVGRLRERMEASYARLDALLDEMQEDSR